MSKETTKQLLTTLEELKEKIAKLAKSEENNKKIVGDLLEKGDLVINAIFFCVARKIFLPRHPVIFSMPRTRRGVKEI